MRAFLVLAAVAVAVAAYSTGAFAQHGATPVLTGTDGPGFTITLKVTGKTVKTLSAGPYKLVNSRQASIPGRAPDGQP